MKVSVKTLKGSHFSLDVEKTDTVLAVKVRIEELLGKDVFPSSKQLLIHKGTMLKDDTTMEQNKVEENSFLVVMLRKNKEASPASQVAASGSGAAQVPATSSPPAPAPSPAAPASPAAAPSPAPTPTPTMPAPVTTPATTPTTISAAQPTPVTTPATTPTTISAAQPPDLYGQAASNLVAGTNLEQTIEWIMDMGGGSWDRETVTRALRAAFNNPERAVEYLYSFQALRDMVQANPQILQPMLLELGKQNPQLLRLINDNQAEFLRLINEAHAEGAEGNMLGHLAEAMPNTINVTQEEREAIERLEALGFDRARVIEAYLACDRNELLAANYLLEDPGENEE
ncbi:hypothetical protein L7F22_066328 [Adiantum nelumboides]|nr:hypothetical protein [Adiantum nelumboides]